MYLICALLLLGTAGAALDPVPCVTPNGEDAVCISIMNCALIRDGVLNLNQSAIEFAKKSACGYEDKVPLVCCGSTGIVNPKPAQQTPEKLKPSVAPIDNILLPDHSLCGIQTRQDRNIGKNNADIDEFPWMAALLHRKAEGGYGECKCAGTLINQRHVLTAAQCLFIPGFEIAAVRLGEWKLYSSTDCDSTADGQVCADEVLDIPVVRRIPHPFYSARSGNNDIALLRLRNNVEYTDYVRPICLPLPNLATPAPGSLMEIAGWGITPNGQYSDVKLKLPMVIVGSEQCSKHYPNFTQVHINQECVKLANNKRVCSSDSGVPLMRTYEKTDVTEEEQWYQEGIVYKGLGCTGSANPTLYTRVARYTSWIVNNLE